MTTKQTYLHKSISHSCHCAYVIPSGYISVCVCIKGMNSCAPIIGNAGYV